MIFISDLYQKEKLEDELYMGKIRSGTQPGCFARVGTGPGRIRSRLFLGGLIWIRIRVNSTLLVLDVIIKTESKDFLFLKHKRLEIIHRNKGRHIANKT